MKVKAILSKVAVNFFFTAMTLSFLSGAFLVGMKYEAYLRENPQVPKAILVTEAELSAHPMPRIPPPKAIAVMETPNAQAETETTSWLPWKWPWFQPPKPKAPPAIDPDTGKPVIYHIGPQSKQDRSPREPVPYAKLDPGYPYGSYYVHSWQENPMGGPSEKLIVKVRKDQDRKFYIIYTPKPFCPNGDKVGMRFVRYREKGLPWITHQWGLSKPPEGIELVSKKG